MPKWLQAILMAVVASVAEYWHEAPSVLRAIIACLPLVMGLHLTLAAAWHWRYANRPVVRGEHAMAVARLAAINCAFLILAFSSDAVMGVPYSMAAVALGWSYTVHVSSSVRLLRRMSERDDFPWPPWAATLDDPGERVAKGTPSQGSEPATSQQIEAYLRGLGWSDEKINALHGEHFSDPAVDETIEE